MGTHDAANPYVYSYYVNFVVPAALPAGSTTWEIQYYVDEGSSPTVPDAADPADITGIAP
jgi:hypothetical protein